MRSFKYFRMPPYTSWIRIQFIVQSGTKGQKEMAAAALAQVCQSMSYVMIYGTAVALNTLCAQAIGSGNARLVGSWLQVQGVVCLG